MSTAVSSAQPLVTRGHYSSFGAHSVQSDSFGYDYDPDSCEHCLARCRECTCAAAAVSCSCCASDAERCSAARARCAKHWRSPQHVSLGAAYWCTYAIGTLFVQPVGKLTIVGSPFDGSPPKLMELWLFTLFVLFVATVLIAGVLMSQIPSTRVLFFSFLFGFAGTIAQLVVSDDPLTCYWVATGFYTMAVGGGVLALIMLIVRQVAVAQRTAVLLLSSFFCLPVPAIVQYLLHLALPRPGPDAFVLLVCVSGAGAVLGIHEQRSPFEHDHHGDACAGTAAGTSGSAASVGRAPSASTASDIPAAPSAHTGDRVGGQPADTTAGGTAPSPSSSSAARLPLPPLELGPMGAGWTDSALGRRDAERRALQDEAEARAGRCRARCRSALPLIACGLLCGVCTFTFFAFSVWALGYRPADPALSARLVVGVVVAAEVACSSALALVCFCTRVLSDRALVVGVTSLMVVAAVVQAIDNPSPLGALVQYAVANGFVCACALCLISVSTALISKMSLGRWLALKFAALLALYAVALVTGAEFAQHALFGYRLRVLPFLPILGPVLCALVLGPLWHRLIPVFNSPWTLAFRAVPFAERVWRVRALLDPRSFLHSPAYSQDAVPLGADEDPTDALGEHMPLRTAPPSAAAPATGPAAATTGSGGGVGGMEPVGARRVPRPASGTAVPALLTAGSGTRVAYESLD